METKFQIVDAEENVVFLEAEKKDDGTFTMSGHFRGGSVGQMIDDITPKNKEQKAIISFWKKNHLKKISDAQWDKFLSLVQIVKEDEIKDLDKGADWAIIEDDKIKALGKHLGLTPVQSQKSIKNLGGNTYEVGKTGNFLVCTDAEADEECVENLTNYVDDVGDISTAFNWSNMGGIEQFVDKDWFIDAIRESFEFYVEDIETEDNRLPEEMLDVGIITEEQKEKEEWGEEEKEKYVDYLSQGVDDPIQYYVDNFGKDSFDTAVKNNNLINMDEVVSEVIATDGRGHVLNSYDGNEYEEDVDGVTYYIYEQ